MATDGTFVLADIGGYTQFLTGVGIEHGREITSHLLNSLLKCNRERWKLANVEGDCLFFYRPGREPPDELMEHVEALFEEFFDRTVDITARASCPCGACSRTNELTLKFIVHAGAFDTHKVGNREELIGPDVVLAHRLLKNSVSVPEYALLTDAYLDGTSPKGAVTHGSDDLDIGPVSYVSLDLAPVRRVLEQKRRYFLTREDAKLKVECEIDAPPDVVWNAMVVTEQRMRWQTTIKEMIVLGDKKREVGEVHRCLHDDGSRIIHFTIAIDETLRRKTEKLWFSRLAKDCYVTVGADPLPNGRTLALLYATVAPGIPLISHIALPIMLRIMMSSVRKDMAGLKVLCESRLPGDA